MDRRRKSEESHLDGLGVHGSAALAGFSPARLSQDATQTATKLVRPENDCNEGVAGVAEEEDQAA